MTLTWYWRGDRVEDDEECNGGLYEKSMKYLQKFHEKFMKIIKTVYYF